MIQNSEEVGYHGDWMNGEGRGNAIKLMIVLRVVVEQVGYPWIEW